MRKRRHEAAVYLLEHPERLQESDEALAVHLRDVGLYSRATNTHDMNVPAIRYHVENLKANTEAGAREIARLSTNGRQP
jgi:hypothetical protein